MREHSEYHQALLNMIPEELLNYFFRIAPGYSKSGKDILQASLNHIPLIRFRELEIERTAGRIRHNKKLPTNLGIKTQIFNYLPEDLRAILILSYYKLEKLTAENSDEYRHIHKLHSEIIFLYLRHLKPMPDICQGPPPDTFSEWAPRWEEIHFRYTIGCIQSISLDPCSETVDINFNRFAMIHLFVRGLLIQFIGSGESCIHPVRTVAIDSMVTSRTLRLDLKPFKISPQSDISHAKIIRVDSLENGESKSIRRVYKVNTRP